MSESVYQLIAQINARIGAMEESINLLAANSGVSFRHMLTLEREALSQLATISQAVLPPEPAAFLLITWGTPSPASSPAAPNRLLQGDNMPVSLNSGQSVPFNCTPLNAQGGASLATLSNLSFTTSDATVFSVVPDPANPTGGIVTALTPSVTPDAAALTATGTATEPDGVTQETVSGTDTVTVIAVAPPPPPPPVAASIGITWGAVSSHKK